MVRKSWEEPDLKNGEYIDWIIYCFRNDTFVNVYRCIIIMSIFLTILNLFTRNLIVNFFNYFLSTSQKEVNKTRTYLPLKSNFFNIFNNHIRILV